MLTKNDVFFMRKRHHFWWSSQTNIGPFLFFQSFSVNKSTFIQCQNWILNHKINIFTFQMHSFQNKKYFFAKSARLWWKFRIIELEKWEMIGCICTHQKDILKLTDLYCMIFYWSTIIFTKTKNLRHFKGIFICGWDMNLGCKELYRDLAIMCL